MEMRLDRLIADAVSRLLGRLVRRAIAVLALGLFLLVTIYQLTAAGTLVLGATYGLVNARLIVAGIFAMAAIGALVFLFATRARAEPAPEGLQPRTMGIAMVLETLLLGYALGRGKARSTLKRT
jgi:hypothetical protein